MRNNLPLLIAVAGGALAFFWWKQREGKAAVSGPPPASYQLTTESVPAEWIEQTPEGYSVTGSTNELYDILT